MSSKAGVLLIMNKDEYELLVQFSQELIVLFFKKNKKN